jgi:hypothetical protein
VIRIDKSKTAPAKLTNEGKTKTDSHILEYNQSPQDYQSGKNKFTFSSEIYGDSSVKQALISRHSIKNVVSANASSAMMAI